jgi:5-methylcytosine-specific restriction enzyme subunit McrC
MTASSVKSFSAFSSESMFFMLMYAWRLWPGGHTSRGKSSDTSTPPELLAKLLSDAIARAIKAGLQRSYISIKEETNLPSGRILIQETIRNRSKRRQTIHVERDTFSEDCTPNQILKEAGKSLLTLCADKNVKQELGKSLNKFSNISDTDWNERVILTELNQARRAEYRLGLSVALTLKQSKILSPAKPADIAIIYPDLSDEQFFRVLFESFLREFYRYNLSDSFVGGRRYFWSDDQSGKFPIMQTDINIESDTSILVIDAKCTPKVSSTRGTFEKNTLNSGHLYQLFSYMSHCKVLNPTKRIEGVLIYPLYDNYVNSSAITPSGSLRVITVDFKQEWNEISRDLLAIALAKS